MTSIFPERFFDSDYEMNTNEKLYIIDCSKEWAQARQEYDNLMEEYYLRTEKQTSLLRAIILHVLKSEMSLLIKWLG